MDNTGPKIPDITYYGSFEDGSFGSPFWSSSPISKLLFIDPAQESMEPESYNEESTDLRVLIVEDNEEHANLMRHGLQFHEVSFEVEIVATIAAARDILRRQKPDILISELSFADGKVSELVSAEPETENYPLVVLTDRGSEKDAVDLLKAGVLDYVVKTRRKCQEIGDLVQSTLKSWNRIRNIRKAEVNLQQTLRLARSIMDSLPNPVGVLDADGLLLSVNDAWRLGAIEPSFFGEMVNVNSDYLAHCRSIQHPVGKAVAEEIVKVIEGQAADDPLHYSAQSIESLGNRSLVNRSLGGDLPGSLSPRNPVQRNGSGGNHPAEDHASGYQAKGNDFSWYSVSVHPCRGSGRAKAIVIHQDITDRKRLEVNRSEKEIAEQQLSRLTPRENQVMELVVGGKPNKSIARALNISVKTVEMHRSNMMKKLKLRNVTDLVKLAVNAGTKEPETEPV